MPRFVILRHDSPRGAHFDFMLEADDALKTWALPRPPEVGMEIDCEALADHRLAYLDYEGPISAGRGSVARWDEGDYTLECRSEAEWIVNLAGERLIGRAKLLRTESKPNEWRLSFEETDCR
jgi:hypothetical protein